MRGWLLIECTLAFIVLCADSVAEEVPRPAALRMVRSVFWPATVVVWFTHRNMRKLGRFAAIVWFFVICGWLFSLERDRVPSMRAFLVAAQLTLAFVVYCVDAMSAHLHRKPVRRILRSILWVKPIGEYLRDDDSINIVHASLIVWILLTTGWLLSLESDRLLASVLWSS